MAFNSQVSAQEQLDLSTEAPPPGGIWLESLDLTPMATGFGRPTVGATVSGNPLSIGGKRFAHGVGTHADADVTLNLAGGAARFLADVGVDDDLKCFEHLQATTQPQVDFSVWVDGKKAADSGPMRFGDKPVRLDVDLKAAKTLRLSVRKAPHSHFNHVSWGGASLVLLPGAPLPKAIGGIKARERLTEQGTASATLSASEVAKLRASEADASVLWIDSLDLTRARVEPGNLWLGGIVSRPPSDPKPITGRKTAEGAPLRLAAVTYPHGVASSGENELQIDLGGAAKRFLARVGFNTSLSCPKVASGGDALVEVWVDGRLRVRTPHLHGYDRPFDINVDVRGGKLLVINAASEGGPITLAGALLELEPDARFRPRTVKAAPSPPAMIAKRNPDEVRINGPQVVGASPGAPFLFKIPATGKGPLKFEAKALPAGLSLDAHLGIIQGSIRKEGRSQIEMKVTAANGEATRTLVILAARNKLGLTPPMGWNSWNAWGMEVDDAKVRAAADAMISSGLAAQGFQYINIDDGWSDGRDTEGNIKPSAKFPNMVALANYVHAKGLRLGIYSSPGAKTCGGLEGSYKHEEQDARTWASWGIDYLKYDWCSYAEVAKDNSLAELQKPYKIMGSALAGSQRDVVYSLCQYGMGEVWNWGRAVGGNLWRTGADIVDTWASLSDVGFMLDGKDKHIGPGGWNDPDMMILGKLGWGTELHATRLAPNEQVTHVTLWAMLASPLLLGNDLSQLDDFTLDLVQNPEVIAVNQDPRGRQGSRKANEGGVEVWARPLHDGTTAVALFNRGQVAAEAVARWKDVGLRGKQPVRNLWLRQDLGSASDAITVDVPPHGAALLRVGSPR